MKKCLRATSMLICVAAFIVGCGRSGDPQRIIAKAQEDREKSEYKAAAIELKTLLQKTPNHAEARYLLGLTYYDSRDYRMAEQELRRALELSYERSKVMPVLGKSMLMLGEYQKVLDQIPLEAHASDAVQADILTLRARALMGLKQGQKARELLNTALSKQADFADALLALSRIEAGEGKWEESTRLVERAIASAPKHVDAWLMKSELARWNADQAGLLAANQKVLEIDSGNVPARLNIASQHIANNKLDEARKLIAQARVLAPASLAVLHMQAFVDYRSRNYKAANDVIQQVLKLAPDYEPSILLAGAILTELGSFEQAQVYLTNVLERAPRNIFARKLLVSTLARNGQMQRAIDVLQPALKQLPDDSQLMTLAGEIYLQGGEFGKAAQYFDIAAKSDPKNAVARTKLGISRMASGDTERAFSDLESAVEIDSARYQSDMVLIVSHLRRGSFDQALKATESLEKKQPNNPITYNLKAVIYQGKKDIPNARKNFERALELQPTFLAAATNLAQLDLQDKNPKGARARLVSLLDKDKNNTQALLALAELGTALGATTQEQVEWLERARKSSPQLIQPYLTLVRMHTQAGDAKKALEVAQQGQAASPENPLMVELLGTSQTTVGQHEQALTTFRKLVQLQPNSPVAFFLLAGAQERNSDNVGAAESLKRALSIKPDFLDALLALVSLEVRFNRFQEALSVVRQVQQQNPKSAFGLSLEGDVLMAQKKFPEAIKAYEGFHARAKTATSLIKLHVGYVAAGRPDEGDVRLAQWLKDSPGDNAARNYAADYALSRGKYREAIAQYELLRQKQPDNARLLNNLSWAYFQTKDARALGIAERAYKISPDNSAVADTLGTQLIDKGDFTRGIEILEKAVKAAPKSPEIHYHLALGWIKAGDKSKARGALERAFSISEKFSNSAEAKDLLNQLRN